MSGARLATGSGESNVSTGLPLLDHLLIELARAGGFELALEIEPDEPVAEVDEAGAALGRALRPLLRPRAYGDATMWGAVAVISLVAATAGAVAAGERRVASVPA